MTLITLIRHAPIAHDPARGPVLCGRSDPPADLSDRAGLARLAAALPKGAQVRVSPARRCRQTAAALGLKATPDPALWEQDFGAWEGRALADLPDLGPLEGAALAAHRPPGGESFTDLCARIRPCLTPRDDLPHLVIIAHAGVVRAALALALGRPEAGLAFQISAPSLTQISGVDGKTWAICRVNAAF